MASGAGDDKTKLIKAVNYTHKLFHLTSEVNESLQTICKKMFNELKDIYTTSLHISSTSAKKKECSDKKKNNTCLEVGVIQNKIENFVFRLSAVRYLLVLVAQKLDRLGMLTAHIDGSTNEFKRVLQQGENSRTVGELKDQKSQLYPFTACSIVVSNIQEIRENLVDGLNKGNSNAAVSPFESLSGTSIVSLVESILTISEHYKYEMGVWKERYSKERDESHIYDIANILHTIDLCVAAVEEEITEIKEANNKLMERGEYLRSAQVEMKKRLKTEQDQYNESSTNKTNKGLLSAIMANGNKNAIVD